jgi:hydrogenase maturation protein HypF
VIWDGTGWGTDHTVWGGELLLGDAAEFRRVAHLRQFRLPGGEAAVREPRRAALGLLFELYGNQAEQLAPNATLDAFTAAERGVLFRMLQQQLHAPLTSSAGRLFDAVASLIGLRQKASFEGQAAAELEYVADSGVADVYPIELQGRADRPLLIDWGPMVEQILSDARHGIPPARIAGKLHHTLADAVLQAARQLARPAGVTKVALSGGCFQNQVLTQLCSGRLERAGFQVLRHRQVPPNDGGISLGQVMVAAAQLAQP